jgi:hypothetical protein
MLNSSFVHADKLANKGEIAEGILGAAMFAKFTKREGNENIGTVTAADIAQVLERLKNVGEDTYEVEVADSDSQHADRVTFKLVLKTKPYQDLMDSTKRDALASEFASAAGYVNSPMAERYSKYFYLNGKADEIAITADGAASETTSKVDVWVAVRDANGDMRRLRLNTSLKIGGVKQFGQVGGSGPESMSKLWGYFGIDLAPEKIEGYIEHLKKGDQSKALAHLYQRIAGLLANKLAGDADNEEARFVDNLAHAVTYFATLGDPNVELVDFSKGGFKILRFRELKDRLREVDLTATYLTGKSQPEISIHDAADPRRALINIRVKVENKKGGEQYMRNYIEKGPLLEELTQVQQRSWSEMPALDPESTRVKIRPKGAPEFRARREGPTAGPERERR